MEQKPQGNRAFRRAKLQRKIGGKRWVMRRDGKRIVLNARPAGVRKYPANGVRP